MDVHEAEREFANVAFEILSKDVFIEILKQMDPIAVLSLCQTNQNFARICREQQTFITLMKVHYPWFPINQDAKAQYVAITAGEGVTYSIPILKVKQLVSEDYDGGSSRVTSLSQTSREKMRALERYKYALFDIEQMARDTDPERDPNMENGATDILRFNFGRIATLAPGAPVPQLLCATQPTVVPTTANFKILGTRIRTGERLWLLIRYNACRIDARVFPTENDVLDSIPFLNNDVDFKAFETFLRDGELDKQRREHHARLEARRPQHVQRQVPTIADEEMNRRLRNAQLPELPLTRERVRAHVARQGFISIAPTIRSRLTGVQASRENLTKTEYQWFKVTIK